MIRGDIMEGKDPKYYIVDSEVLPDVYLKVMEVKRVLQEGNSRSVNDAVKRVGISRSTYYKYKDKIFDFYGHKSEILTLMLMLDNITGTLFGVLHAIAASNANILTINQNIPKDNTAMVSVSIETLRMTEGIDRLLEKIKNLKGVKLLEIVS